MSRLAFIICLLVCIASRSYAVDFSLPSDVTTIEALIDLHKTMATYEEQSKEQEVKSSGTNVWHTRVARKWHDVRDTINSKLDVANQWMGIATAASKTALNILGLTKEYVAFNKFMVNEVGHKPFISWYYAEANHNIYKRVKWVEKSVATIVSSETNILKASMSERATMIWNVDNEISQIRNIINNAMFWMRCCVYNYIKIDYIWEILDSDVMNGIADDIVSRWNKQLSTFGAL